MIRLTRDDGAVWCRESVASADGLLHARYRPNHNSRYCLDCCTADNELDGETKHVWVESESRGEIILLLFSV